MGDQEFPVKAASVLIKDVIWLFGVIAVVLWLW